MARTIAEIKQEMTDAWMAEGAVRERYGLSGSDTFEGKFSKVSIEGLLFYVVAFGIWVPSFSLLYGFFMPSFK